MILVYEFNGETIFREELLPYRAKDDYWKMQELPEYSNVRIFKETNGNGD